MNDLAFKGVDPGVNRVTDGIYTSGDCRYGHMKWLTTDYGVGQALALYGEYSEGEVALFRKLIRKGDTVLCAGANIGAHVVALSKIVGSVGHVIACEPQQMMIPILRENVVVNDCQNVRIEEVGLGAECGELDIALADPEMPNNFGGLGFIAEPGYRTEKRPVVTIDSLELIFCDFILLDVEGMERAALQGARKLIERCRPLLYVEIDKEDKREPLLHFIKDELKYEILFHLPNVFNPDNWARNPENHFGEQRSIMCLAVPT